MSVVGIDFGNTSCIVAVARRGVIDTLQNEVGNRKTASLVGFQSQRFIGDPATAQLSSNYKNTIVNCKRFLGGKYNDPEMKKELSGSMVNHFDDAGKVGFKVKYDGKDEMVKPEQICAALLFKCKQIAEAGLESKVSDVVIGCPQFWSDEQRRALLDAAHLAGLNPLRIMNETTAIALTYGLLRPLPKDETKNVCFIDIGEMASNISIVSFVQGKLKVLGVASERNLGGRDFDDMLVEYFAADIKTRYKLDAKTDPKAMMKLYKECERVKRVLSANITVQFHIEYFMNDVDVSGIIERDAFETMAKQKVTARFIAVCKEAVANAGVKVEDLNAIEVVGGAVRIPILQSELSVFFGKEISKTCDGDESVARGCALACAMLSPSVKVREFEVQDITPYPVEVAWGPVPAAGQPLQEESSSILFTQGNLIPSVKMISFKERTQPFQLVARYVDPSKLPSGTDPIIGRFIISGMPPTVPADAMGPPKIKVKVSMNLHGVLEVTSAQLLTNYEEAEDAKAADVKDAKKDDKKDAKADKVKDAKMKDADAKDADAKEADAKDAGEDADAEMDTSAHKKKKVTKRENLKVQSFVAGLSQKVIQVLLEREAAMAHADRVIVETNAARNSLESYVLEQRVRMVEQLKDFVEQSVSDTFCETCRNTEDWLYGEGDDAQKSAYTSRLTDLKKVGDAVEKRFFEFEQRPQYITGLRKEISNWEGFALTTDEKFSHITEEERSKIKEECSKLNSWLSGEIAKLETLPKHVDPNFTCEQLTVKSKELAKICTPIYNKPKPKPPKEEKKAEKKADEKKPGEDAPPKEETPAADGAPAATGEAKADGMDTTAE